MEKVSISNSARSAYNKERELRRDINNSIIEMEKTVREITESVDNFNAEIGRLIKERNNLITQRDSLFATIDHLHNYRRML